MAPVVEGPHSVTLPWRSDEELLQHILTLGAWLLTKRPDLKLPNEQMLELERIIVTHADSDHSPYDCDLWPVLRTHLDF